MPSFDKAELEQAFESIGERANQAGLTVEIAVYGGAAMLLTFPERASTRDVDAVVGSDQQWLRRTVAEIASERNWPADWLNDGVKGWLSAADSAPGSKTLLRSYPDEDRPGLRVFVAAPHYLFAMKCIAMRLGGVETASDREDIELLAGRIGISTLEAAVQTVSQFYPESRVPPKTRFGLEEIFGAGGRDGRH